MAYTALMPFCTKCGANVTGAFCNQCGTPAAGAAPPAPPAMAAPYATAAPYAPPVARKTSPIVWVLVIVLGLFVLGGLGVASMIAFIAHRARQAGVAFNGGRDGGFSIQTRGADGKNATVEFGTSSAKLPSWVPVYPGSEGHTQFAVRGSNGGAEGGSFNFATSDDVQQVKSFYKERCGNLGMKLDMESDTAEGGMIIAADEAGEKRSLTVIVGRRPGGTTVNVIYGQK